MFFYRNAVESNTVLAKYLGHMVNDLPLHVHTHLHSFHLAIYPTILLSPLRPFYSTFLLLLSFFLFIYSSFFCSIFLLPFLFSSLLLFFFYYFPCFPFFSLSFSSFLYFSFHFIVYFSPFLSLLLLFTHSSYFVYFSITFFFCLILITLLLSLHNN